MPELMYYYEDAVKFISERCDVNEEDILKILELELDYMRSIGLVEEVKDE